MLSAVLSFENLTKCCALSETPYSSHVVTIIPGLEE